MAIQWKTVGDTLIVIVHLLTDWFLEFTLGWYLGPRKCCSPPVAIEQERIITKSAVELARLIREHKLTSYDVVKAFIDRTIQINPQINAVVDGPFHEALEEAKAIDVRLAADEIPAEELAAKPFLGVPFTTKDSTEVAGKLYTLGLVARRNTRGTTDAECVQLMKQSGAIIIATSNVPEVNKWIESRNMLIGQTNNPYDFRRSVGGSSGGEGALVTACCTAFGLGTDIGGSIRIPSFNCGIFGHKPTMNAVNMRGCTFRTGKEKQTMVAAGPMTRSAQDLMPIFKVMTGPVMSKNLKLDERVNLKKLRYFYVPCNNMRLCNPIGKDAQMTMFKVRQHFANLSGQDVQFANLPGTEITSKLWRYWMLQEPANFKNLLGNGAELNPIVELFKKLIGQSEFTLAAIYSLIDGLLPSKHEQFYKEATVKCQKALKELLGDDGVLFFHSSPRTAPFHYYPLMKIMDFSYFSIFNVLHVPATQVPMGLSADGMPLGIQVIASEMNDRLCIAVAEELERTFGGWVPPFTVKQN